MINMEEILLALVCQEFDIEEKTLFSDAQFYFIQDAISMMTYVLITEYKWRPVDVHDFYKKKGFNKYRSVLYSHMSRAQKNIRDTNGYRERYASLIEGVEIAKDKKFITDIDKDIYTIIGRIVNNLSVIKNVSHLSKIEDLTRTLKKAEFIKEAQFED